MEKSIKTKFWIHKSIFECPVCGREKVYRSRKYGEKPENFFERFEIIQDYDWCNE